MESNSKANRLPAETLRHARFHRRHPSLKLGSFVKVTNLRNGKTVVVRINDRGPVVDGRIIDLSYNAARALDFQEPVCRGSPWGGPVSAREFPAELPAIGRGAAATRSQSELNDTLGNEAFEKRSLENKGPKTGAEKMDPRQRLILPWMYRPPRPPGRSWRPSATPPSPTKSACSSTPRRPLDCRGTGDFRPPRLPRPQIPRHPKHRAAAVREAAELGVDMLTVHASGGGKMLRAAVDAAQAKPGCCGWQSRLLTSLDDVELGKIGRARSAWTKS